MSKPDLEGVFAKIRRADETLALLRSELEAYLATNYRISRRAFREERQYKLFAHGEPSLPPRFAVLVGEIVHQLRSTLDHAITQLATIGPGGGDPSALEFPVCRSEEAFLRSCERGKLKGLPGTAIDLINRMQPYNAWRPAEDSTLLALHDFDRIDKHRLLVVVVAAVRMADQFTIKGTGGAPLIGMTPPVPRGTRPSAEGTPIFGFVFGDELDSDLEIDGNFAFTVVFEQVGTNKDVPVIDTLRKMRDLVVRLLGDFFPEHIKVDVAPSSAAHESKKA